MCMCCERCILSYDFAGKSFEECSSSSILCTHFLDFVCILISTSNKSKQHLCERTSWRPVTKVVIKRLSHCCLCLSIWWWYLGLIIFTNRSRGRVWGLISIVNGTVTCGCRSSFAHSIVGDATWINRINIYPFFVSPYYTMIFISPYPYDTQFSPGNADTACKSKFLHAVEWGIHSKSRSYFLPRCPIDSHSTVNPKHVFVFYTSQ